MWVMTFSALCAHGVFVDLPGADLDGIVTVKAKSPRFVDEEKRLS